jgi:type III pantothenate kinase
MGKTGILLIDIGNTNILIGYSLVNQDVEGIKSFRFSTNKSATVDDFGMNLTFLMNSLALRKETIKLALISSVVPEVNNIIKNAIKKYIHCETIFTDEIELKKIEKIIKINYKNPKEIGADRIVNSIASISLYQYPAIIVDIGTAATIDIINSKKEYIGGAILPGIGISVNSLAKMTSKLPKINFETVKNIIGTDTVESIQSGVYHGFLGSIKYFKEELHKQKDLKNAIVILTGGYTDIYKDKKEIFDIYDKDLTLKGLKIIFDKFFSV